MGAGRGGAGAHRGGGGQRGSDPTGVRPAVRAKPLPCVLQRPQAAWVLKGCAVRESKACAVTRRCCRQIPGGAEHGQRQSIVSLRLLYPAALLVGACAPLPLLRSGGTSGCPRAGLWRLVSAVCPSASFHPSSAGCRLLGAAARRALYTFRGNEFRW